MMRIDEGSWCYSPDHGQLCQVIETQTLWGETTCRVWLPGRDSVVRIPASRLKSLESAGTGSPDDIAYVAAAARVADALTQDVLLAPIESSVIPLPHQIRALSRAIANDRVRYLLADEVGLGKTIEAGLIMRELKLRGLVKRTLVIAPKGLVSQWVSEMRFHFGETFQLVLPEDIKTLKRIAPVTGPGNGEKGNHDPEALPANAWQMFSQVVVPMDSVKPLDKRRGWTAAQVGEHNRERFEDLISAGWDLVIVDEAHRLGGSTDQVARFKLGQGLSEAAPYFLLLSATPHQGKTDAFHRLVSLIDAQEFPDIGSVTRERVQPYVIRTEKRRAIDADGKPLFKPRRTQLVPVSWEERHRNQQLLYEAVTEYVREGYNQAMREKRSYIGFLMILMQRLVVSSTSAIRTTLERRLEALAAPQEQLTLFPLTSEEEWADLDGQEQIDVLLRTRLKALKNERAEVKLLLDAAARCEQIGPDAKAEALLDWLYRLQSEEGDPELKVLVFTEFVPTQEMLRRFLTERGFSVVCLNGSMDMEERKRVQEAFAKDARILISTDAGGEGLNLQFCHVVINYDIPWNPMRLEQRIGRVDRIGQAHAVRAVNFVFEDSVEHRVREVLEQKLAVIFEEFGIDKTGDVLDSAQAGQHVRRNVCRGDPQPRKGGGLRGERGCPLAGAGPRGAHDRIRARRDRGPGAWRSPAAADPPLAPLGRAHDRELPEGAWRPGREEKPELEPHLARRRNLRERGLHRQGSREASGRPASHPGRAEGPRSGHAASPFRARPAGPHRVDPRSLRGSPEASGPCGESRLPPWSGTVEGSCLSSWPTTAWSTCRRPDTCGTSSSRQAHRSGPFLTPRSPKPPSQSCRTPRKNTGSPSTKRSCKSTGPASHASARRPTTPLPPAARPSSGSVCPRSATIV